MNQCITKQLVCATCNSEVFEEIDSGIFCFSCGEELGESADEIRNDTEYMVLTKKYEDHINKKF